MLAACSESPTDEGSPCDLVRCVPNAHCSLLPDPVCVCDQGFTFRDNACVPADPVGSERPGERTEQTVCEEWKRAHADVSKDPFTPGADRCAPGTLDPAGIADTVERVNLFRWLVGLDPVVDDARLNAVSQRCAVLTAWNPPRAGYNPHFPTPEADCYDDEGAAGAGQSNLAWGSGHPAAAIDQFMEDRGSEDTLGHRRWILYPPLGPIGVGYYANQATAYRNAECLHVFRHEGGGKRPDWYALPPPGPSPLAISRWPWSFHAATLKPSAVTVTMRKAGTDEPLAIDVTPLPNGYGDPAVSWTPRDWIPFPGETYVVTVTGFQSTPLSWEVTPVDCR